MTWDGYQKDESAQWGKAVTEAYQEGSPAKDAIVTGAAARGFSVCPGESQYMLQEINTKIQAKLLEANAKIYEIEAGRTLQDEELTANLSLAMLKASLDLYKANQQNLYELEEAEAEHLIQLRKADLDRLLSQIDLNQATLIQMKADLEFDMSGYRLRVVNAELITLAAERELSQEKYETALEKLKIIDELYKLIDAEQLVLVAEREKMAALDKVIEAEKLVAEVKKAMIPFYLEKADAKEMLAAAITEDSKVQRDILMLGYDRIALKDAQEGADETLRQAEIAWETAHNEWVLANLATELARIKARIALMQHSTEIDYSVLGYDMESLKKKIDLRLGREIWNGSLEKTYNTKEGIVSVQQTGLYASSHAMELIQRATRHIDRGSGTVEHLTIKKE